MLKTIFWLLLAYVIGSIPWGLIIGKVFFHKDIRQYGSGNLGGTNAGRVLGTPIGILVILLDSMKAFLMMLLCNKFNPGIEQYIGLMVCVGHCFPIFANFKGGKAVACSYGYLLGLALFVTNEFIFTFLIPLIVFLITLVISKMVSLSSMVGLSSAVFTLLKVNYKLSILQLILALFVIYRHSANIKRIINKTESKISFKKKR